MVYWKFSTLCADVCHAASFMQMSKKIAIIHGENSGNHRYGHPFNLSHVSKVIVVLFCTLPLVGTSQKGLKCI
jgi:hypothetical protein